MDNVSVSKGVFCYKGNYKINQKKKKLNNNCFNGEAWYESYTNAWKTIQSTAEEINANMFQQILTDLVKYVRSEENNPLEFHCEISTAILLTGVNLPDHKTLFDRIATTFNKVTNNIAIIQSRDSGNIKSLTEETVYQLINSSSEEYNPEVKKSQCSFRLLKSWYLQNCSPKTPLIIIIPDFESFNPSILRDFILILSSYAENIRFVLLFGVATTLHAVHKSLSYDVTSKLRIQVFHTQTQIKSLSDILEGTVLSGKTSFMLTGRAFQLLTDIFLFYDFSVHGFLQGYKLCMMQHFYGNNITALCCEKEQLGKQINKLNEYDLKELKKLPTISQYIENNSKTKEIDTNSKQFKNTIVQLLSEFLDNSSGFFTILRCLHYLSYSLPGAPLGKQLREVYSTAVTCDLTKTQEYRDSLQLLNFLSKEELLLKLDYISNIIKDSNNNDLEVIYKSLKKHRDTIEKASLDVSANTSTEMITTNSKLSRIQLKEKLLKMSQTQSRSPFKEAQLSLMNYLDDKVFSVFLKNPNRLPGSEIFCFSDANAGKHHLRGSLRSAIHTALNDPQIYLNCDCCKMESEETILPTFPDLSVIYKLHLESRKLINMYDWLQAFVTIVDPDENEDNQNEVDPKIQARFTQAVAELQFLGFIKATRRKTDHVKRLT